VFIVSLNATTLMALLKLTQFSEIFRTILCLGFRRATEHPVI